MRRRAICSTRTSTGSRGRDGVGHGRTDGRRDDWDLRDLAHGRVRHDLGRGGREHERHVPRVLQCVRAEGLQGADRDGRRVPELDLEGLLLEACGRRNIVGDRRGRVDWWAWRTARRPGRRARYSGRASWRSRGAAWGRRSAVRSRRRRGLGVVARQAVVLATVPHRVEIPSSRLVGERLALVGGARGGVHALFHSHRSSRLRAWIECCAVRPQLGAGCIEDRHLEIHLDERGWGKLHQWRFRGSLWVGRRWCGARGWDRWSRRRIDRWTGVRTSRSAVSSRTCWNHVHLGTVRVGGIEYEWRASDGRVIARSRHHERRDPCSLGFRILTLERYEHCLLRDKSRRRTIISIVPGTPLNAASGRTCLFVPAGPERGEFATGFFCGIR